MSDDSSALAAANAGELGAEALSADAIETLLSDFRAWLQEARETPVPLPAGEKDDFDVAAVLRQFIALRQEVNLQTKASRAQLEQNSQAVAMLQETLGTLERQQAQLEDADGGEDEIARPLLKTLIDAHDALALAEREVRRLLEKPPPEAPALSDAAPPVIKLKIPHWARWIGLDASVEAQLAPLYAWRRTQQPEPDPIVERYRQSLDALLTGYRMSRQRIERALEQQGLQPIVCVGEPFDPETMEVAEVVRDETRSSAEVIDELRRGYLWNGRLFRYAQVRVAKP
jgi:molecular chaperone GrpE